MEVHMATRDDYPFMQSTCGVSEQDEPVLDWAGFLRYLYDWEPYDVLPCPDCLVVVQSAVAMLR